ncbi:nucleotidyltransferase family protein [Arthrobacter sp. AOP36-A1-22]|uniref:nucleotidyltransferase family protein n=1 Tax=Arthrobacter sp. AOP36-A1-22 TaxID=3457684 RepID=UPI0040342C3A
MKSSGGVSEVDQHTTTLRSQESVLLSAALVAQICEDLQVRVLFIKGPVAVQIGVRPPGDSNDIDVLVEPGKSETVVEGLADRGWKLRSNEVCPPQPIHSVTMFHPQWPTDIDIHFVFPGIEAPPETSFPLLWKHRQEFTLASRPVLGLDRSGATIIQALHALRAPALPKNVSELDYLLHEAAMPSWSEIRDLAADIDALASMKPYLLAAYPQAIEVDFPEVSSDWVQRTTVSAPGVHRLLQLASLPPNRRWPLIRRALFPPRRMFEESNRSLMGVGRVHVLRIRIVRWGSFLRSLPQILREYRTVRNGQGRA